MFLFIKRACISGGSLPTRPEIRTEALNFSFQHA